MLRREGWSVSTAGVETSEASSAVAGVGVAVGSALTRRDEVVSVMGLDMVEATDWLRALESAGVAIAGDERVPLPPPRPRLPLPPQRPRPRPRFGTRVGVSSEAVCGTLVSRRSGSNSGEGEGELGRYGLWSGGTGDF